MQPQSLAALKRCALRVTGHRATLTSRFCARLDELAPGLGRRLEGDASDMLVIGWLEAARCADRWRNVAPLLGRAGAALAACGIRASERDCLPESWVAAIEDTLGEPLDGELRADWRALAARCQQTMERAAAEPAFDG